LDLEIENSLEAWSIAFSPTWPTSGEDRSNISVYCGGDDSMLRYTSCSWMANGKDADPETPYGSVTLKGKHDAGVTAILPLDLKSQQGGRVVVTGSYDDRLRVFVIFDLDATYGQRRVEQVVEKDLGGGVWRLDLVTLKISGDSARIVLLASCMHAGARVVELCVAGDVTWTCRILTKFEEHKSMNYASDYCPRDTGKLRIASSSFYDKLLCLWESDVTV
jgi:diphthamide biosynthesis protein 7